MIQKIKMILLLFETLIFKQKAEEAIAVWAKVVNAGMDIILDPEFNPAEGSSVEEFYSLYIYAQATHSKANGMIADGRYWAAYDLLGNAKHLVDGAGEFDGRSLVQELGRLIYFVDPKWQKVYSGKAFVTTTDGTPCLGAGGSGGSGLVVFHGIGGTGGGYQA